MDFQNPEIHTEDELRSIITCAASLDQIPGCRHIVDSLKDITQDNFKDIPEKQGIKSISNIYYYSNGLVR